jgi:drug/metabolite transporter (DMT)-like permease
MGGLASKRELPLAITWFSQMVGLASITLVALFVPADVVTAADWGWGALGGLSGALGLVLLYGALARGPMAVVAPITALMSAIVPVVAGIIEGDRPGGLAVLGVVLAFPAIVLVASAGGIERDAVGARVLVESVIAGFGFGMFFVFFASAGEHAGLWPAVSAKVASVGALTLVVLIWGVRQGRPRVQRSSLPLIAGAGVFDVFANAVYLIASRKGLLSEISVVSAMYPAATVVLASVLLRERIGRAQLAGLMLAAAAVGLVAYGRSAA